MTSEEKNDHRSDLASGGSNNLDDCSYKIQLLHLVRVTFPVISWNKTCACVLPDSRLTASVKAFLPSKVFPLELFPDPVFPTRTSLMSDTGTQRVDQGSG